MGTHDIDASVSAVTGKLPSSPLCQRGSAQRWEICHSRKLWIVRVRLKERQVEDARLHGSLLDAYDDDPGVQELQLLVAHVGAHPRSLEAL
jgi:hypothetical protein